MMARLQTVALLNMDFVQNDPYSYHKLCHSFNLIFAPDSDRYGAIQQAQS